jgi:gag-polypeptide of LTR copia-type
MTHARLTEKTVGVLTMGTWPKWSRKCKAILRADAMWAYVEGGKTQPPPASDAANLKDWNGMNHRIIRALCQVVEDSLAQEIERYTSASDAWTYLKTKTYQSCPNFKPHALQNAMRLRFSTAASASLVLTELKDYTEAIYSDEAPTKDEWTVGILLHAMSNSDFDSLWKILMASSSTLTPSDIIERIEAEAQETRHRESMKIDDTILAAKPKQIKNHKSVICSNCDKAGHTFEKCWEKGGGCEGKAPDWWKTAKEKQCQGGDMKRK